MIYITDHQALSVNAFKFFGEYDDSEFTVVIELHKTDSGMEYEIENNLGLDEAELMAAVSKYMEKFCWNFKFFMCQYWILKFKK